MNTQMLNKAVGQAILWATGLGLSTALLSGDERSTAAGPSCDGQGRMSDGTKVANRSRAQPGVHIGSMSGDLRG